MFEFTIRAAFVTEVTPSDDTVHALVRAGGRKKAQIIARPATKRVLSQMLSALSIETTPDEDADIVFVDDWDPNASARFAQSSAAHRVLMRHFSGEGIATPPGAVELYQPLTRGRLQSCARMLFERERIDPAQPSTLDAPRAKALIVEDNIVNQQVAVGILRKLGFEPVAVSNGEEALAAVSQSSFELVLMDCQMPVMDGYEATARIRADEAAHPGGHHLPIIALTANAMQGDRERCLAAGMDDYLSKPLKIDTLSETLDRWLARDAA